ncbi:MAG: glutamate-5-semialdehyde dehydrogenase [Myxococcales bacterium]|nr:glutamate-5-semialdehyde dehydrogenase [Myxococcales bacterium]MDH5307762.1 glutamate-5-semialdehyde dehydrogenase [Myxococcales bacterium]MDH5566542.1 glutamate-5-semialdehyde dehydrogenase [Myxococcales bacterium]
MNLRELIHDIAQRARTASERTAELSSAQKDAWLGCAARRLEAARERIAAENARDLEQAERNGLAAPLHKRLELSAGKWHDMIAGLRDVANLPDPIGRVEQTQVRPNGLQVGRMRIPLGVIAIIYESRPNVTVDAAALCVKSGNAVILRGGSEALHTNLALAEELRAAARETEVPEDAVCVVPTTDREAIAHLLHEDRCIDLVIPRGGPGLIRVVTETSRIPVIKHDAGVCHVFLDASADPEMATKIVIDSKLRQMEVCNGLETLLVHRDAMHTALPRVLKALHEEGIELRGDERTREIFGDAVPAREEDWSREYLGPVLAVRVVDDLDAAVAHIRRYGSDHTEVIVTESYANAQEWLRRINSSTVGVNCSTAFADGYRLGLGAEIGISTSKLHAYGPMGLEGLTTLKFVLRGDGQLRE